MAKDIRTDAEKRASHASDPTVFNVRLTNMCPHNKASNTCCGYAEWLRVIHAVNGQRDGSFGEPLAMYDWNGRPGIWCEEYPEFRVLIRDDGTTNLQAKTDDAKALLKAALLTVTGHTYDDNGFPQ